jgi:hypothetical protein
MKYELINRKNIYIISIFRNIKLYVIIKDLNYYIFILY